MDFDNFPTFNTVLFFFVLGEAFYMIGNKIGKDIGFGGTLSWL